MDWFLYDNDLCYLSEWAPRRSFNFVLSEKVFLKYAANLQENTHAEVGFQ